MEGDSKQGKFQKQKVGENKSGSSNHKQFSVTRIQNGEEKVIGNDAKNVSKNQMMGKMP